MKRQRQDMALTRMELLESGRQILLEEGTPEGLAVKVADACRRIGYTTGAAYPIWRSQEAFQRDLALHVASSFEWAGPEAIADEVADVLATVDNHIDGTRVLAPIYFSRFVEQDDFYHALRFWSVPSPSADLSKALAEGYQVVHDGFVELFGSLLDLYGRRMKAPYTLDQATWLITALVEGLALRRRIEPDVVDSPITGPDGDATTLFTEGMIAMTEHFTEPIPEDEAPESPT